mmetsp:Transcript_10470/g.11557  ORF Transcript_10470/g.11557 Transcript_10470/m.11557 type:complete len:128 (-) Transcript_10470:81-464(-)
MKFDTSDYDTVKEGSKVSLRLGVADIHESKSVHIKVYAMKDDFHEDHIDWNTFNGFTTRASMIDFHVNADQKDKIGEIDVSELMYDGQDIVFAFIVEGEGHVKFHSKEHTASVMMRPRLVIDRRTEL